MLHKMREKKTFTGILSFIVGIGFSTVFFEASGQVGGIGGAPNPFSVNIIPPSPEAAALAKYADIPVSLYSGIPQIAIPLYELHERKLTLPITLSYHASGNKVENMAPRTGLGWSLLSEGVVTRTVRGWPDENSSYGFLNQVRSHVLTDFTTSSRTPEERYDWFSSMVDGCKDIEPDLFYVNVAGYSFKFMFNWRGEPVIASDRPFKVTPIGMNPGTNDFIDGWEIVAEDGTIFTFSEIETTGVVNDLPPLSCRLALSEEDIPQSWYLTSIQTPDRQTYINFEYTSYTQQHESWSAEFLSHNAALSSAITSKERLLTAVYGKHLSRIRTSSGQTVIDFLPGSLRTDVDGSESTLGEMIVKNIHGRIVKHWTFEYDYSTGRLTLKKLTEKAGTLSQPPYEFRYYPGTLPGAMSFAKDHWGFYNSNNAQTAIRAIRQAPYGGGDPVQLAGANREPDPGRVLCGMLREITYPTGGKDILEFEPHDYSFEQNVELEQEETLSRYHQASAPEWDTPPGESYTEQVPFTVLSATDITWNAWFTSSIRFGGGATAPMFLKIIRNSDGETMLLRSAGISGTPDAPGRDDMTGVLALSAGTYTMIVGGGVAEEVIGGINATTATIAWNEGTGQISTLIRQGGGVRIAKITRSYGNGNPDKITRYVYRLQEDGREKSSGSLLEWGYRYEDWVQYANSDPTNQNEMRFCRFSQNKSAIGTTHGSHVGYSHVTVLHGADGENGKTVYRYNSPRQVVDYPFFQIPYPPAASNDHQRGLLLEQIDYASNGISVKKVTNNYRFNDQEVKGVKVGWLHPGTAPTGPGFLDRYAVVNYSNILGYSRLVNTQETNYPTTLAFPLVTGVAYWYHENGHKQLIRMGRKTSEQDSVITQYTYPHDHSAPAGSALDNMKNRHILNQVIESVSWEKATNTTPVLVAAAKKSFTTQSNVIVPSAEWSARLPNPMPTTDPLGTARQQYEERLIYHAYDTYGNLRAHAMKNGISTAYVWGLNGTVPFAKVEHAQSWQIFFTSFEEDNQAIDGISRTGRKCKTIAGTFTLPGMPVSGGDYILSYWTKEGTAPWTYREKTIVNYQTGNVIATDAVNGYLDEVRLYPKGAAMTTFTYEPLVGLTSVTDTNNVTIHYSYDAFGRLSCVRDQDQNILECNEYKYQEEVPYAVQH
jgi:YD repeat-containing protein